MSDVYPATERPIDAMTKRQLISEENDMWNPRAKEKAK